MFRLSFMNRLAIFLIMTSSCSCTFQANKENTQAKELQLRILQLALAAQPDTSLQISSFLILAPYSIGTIQDTEIAVALPTGTDVTSLKAVFEHTGETLSVNDVAQTSGETANDFTNPVTYILKSSNGTEINYTVTVSIK